MFSHHPRLDNQVDHPLPFRQLSCLFRELMGMTAMLGVTTDVDELRRRYEAMFGFVPDLPAARLPFAARFGPSFQALVEALRSDALDNGVLDAKTAHLVLFALLLGNRPDAAAGHAATARRLGAGFDELLAVTELVALAGALGALNVGGALLARLEDDAPWASATPAVTTAYPAPG
jgi:alkylhydroperoxidase/carboxymuconolactone decarboxylase family protein YurZ